MQSFLGFEDFIADLEGKMEELRHLNDIGDIKIADEVSKLQDRIEKALHQTYSKLSSGQKVQVARHPNRPHCVNYIDGLVDEFTPLAGDRAFAEDAAHYGRNWPVSRALGGGDRPGKRQRHGNPR